MGAVRKRAKGFLTRSKSCNLYEQNILSCVVYLASLLLSVLVSLFRLRDWKNFLKAKQTGKEAALWVLFVAVCVRTILKNI